MKPCSFEIEETHPLSPKRICPLIRETKEPPSTKTWPQTSHTPPVRAALEPRAPEGGRKDRNSPNFPGRVALFWSLNCSGSLTATTDPWSLQGPLRTRTIPLGKEEVRGSRGGRKAEWRVQSSKTEGSGKEGREGRGWRQRS